ncbi:MAG: hypothetical protein BWK80_42985 [Desulfobacteraceae bacterium IS3]|nr:MAG: hypothetical protein BWK80_42985 [Desulfobacteraceae bacterium IS3]
MERTILPAVMVCLGFVSNFFNLKKWQARGGIMKRKGLVVMTVALLAVVWMGMVAEVYAAVPSEERNALIDLYNNTGGASWTNNNNWKPTDSSSDCCEWYGVVCDTAGANATGIDLSNNNLTGQIPSSIENFTELTTLNLSGNTGLTSIPSQIGNLSKLTILNLSGNTGLTSIPSQIGSLSSLTTLDLSGIKKSIPSISNLTNLKTLDVSQNSLTSIPALPSNLTSLDVSQNNLTSLPSALPSTLTSLDASENQLTSLPTLPSNLTSLKVSKNQLTELKNLPVTLDGNNSDFSYNAIFETDNTVPATDPNWADTQTVPPTELDILQPSSDSVYDTTTRTDSISLKWKPISYNVPSGSGGYEIYVSSVSSISGFNLFKTT